MTDAIHVNFVTNENIVAIRNMARCPENIVSLQFIVEIFALFCV